MFIIKNFVLKQFIKNHKQYLKSKLGRFDSSVGATHDSLEVKDSIEYIYNVFNDYLKYGEIENKDFSNKQLLEIGPGDNFGVALLFLAFNAKKVYLVDKFYSTRTIEQQYLIYKELRKTLNKEQQQRYDECITFSEKSFEFNPEKIKYIYGYGIESSKINLPNNYFDFIISRSVLQEIKSLNKVFKKMKMLLKPQGQIIHKIDLRDYGTFRTYKKHNLGMLFFSDFVYTGMTNHLGQPNRKRIDYYRFLIDKYNFKSKIYITTIFGTPERAIVPHKLDIEKGIDFFEKDIEYIEASRKYFSKEFRKLSVKDLLIAGIFINASKE